VTGVAGNALTLAIGKQSAKGTPQVTPTAKLKYTGGFGPTGQRTVLQLAETDAIRQAGDPVIVGISVAGTSDHYLRPSEFHIIADLFMGQTTTTGAGPYVHTAASTPSGSAGYATLYRALNVSTLVEQMIDCQIGGLTVTGGADQALTMSLAWLGLSFAEGATDPVLAVSTETPLVYPNVTVTKGGTAVGIVDSFSIAATQNRTLIQGDSGYQAADIAPGQYAVTGSLSILFENDQDYRAFKTGTTAGTTPGTTIFTEALDITALVTSTNLVQFTITNITSTAYDPPFDTSGAPIRVGLAFQSMRGTTLANVLTVTTKNAIATP